MHNIALNAPLIGVRTAIRRFLRSPKVICIEIGLVAILCTVGASIPQQGVATSSELRDFCARAPFWSDLICALGLDHVFRSPAFLLATFAGCASLLVIVLEQWRRLWIQWRQRLTPAHFSSAPLRIQFERPASNYAHPSGTIPRTQIWSERRLGLAGSAVFHSGLLLVILAAALRATFGAEAVVDLVESEELPPTASAWSGQFPGVAGEPVCFSEPVKLLGVQAARYSSGDLRDLKVRVQLPDSRREEEIAVNRDLRLPGGRLFLANEFGPAALIEWRKEGGFTNRQAALLTAPGGGNFEGSLAVPSGERVHLRTHVDRGGSHPHQVELRVMKGNALVFLGEALVGNTVSLPGGAKVTLCGTPFWARLRGSRDSALWVAYAGFAFVMLGATLIFGVVKLDACVVITPAGQREIVLVAMKPQRFAPLFQERFQTLVEELGGPRVAKEAQVQPTIAKSREPRLRLAQESSPSFSPSLADRVPAMRMPLQLLVVLVTAATLSGCGPSGLSEARRLVERYNSTVAEAYRRADARFADSVVGPSESRKIAGLIGVRQDLGLTLDSELLSLDVTGVERVKGELRVRTRERWRYRDRRVGSGAQVGEESTDNYQMLYVFKKVGKEWLVDEIQFTSSPQVGRKRMSWPSSHNSSPGLATADKMSEGQAQ